jgi:hypothetical protein
MTLDDSIKRWTAKRKTALVIEIIQGNFSTGLLGIKALCSPLRLHWHSGIFCIAGSDWACNLKFRDSGSPVAEVVLTSSNESACSS